MNRFWQGDDEKKPISLKVISVENLKTLQHHVLSIKH